jgi:hypothetical protein
VALGLLLFGTTVLWMTAAMAGHRTSERKTEASEQAWLGEHRQRHRISRSPEDVFG